MSSSQDELTTRERKVVYTILSVVLIILAVLWLTGCSFAGVISKKGAEASDEVLRDSIWTICSAVPVGAVKRKFNTTELVTAYNTLCSSQEKLPLTVGD